MRILGASFAIIVVLMCAGLGSPERTEIELEPGANNPSGPLAPFVASGDDEWAEIPVHQNLSAAQPVAMPSDARARMLIFGGSWCPACVASVLEDTALSERFRDRIEVGFALYNERDEVFARSAMARWLSEMPVWSEDSTRSVAQRCQIRSVPAACLVEGERVLWSGGAGDGQAVLDGHLAGRLEKTLAAAEIADGDYAAATQRGDAAARQRMFTALHGFSSRENQLAWNLVDRETVTANQLAVAVPLARDATNSTSGLDSAILDTYALALWKNGEREDAARVGRRVIAVCDAIGGGCFAERARAERFISAVATDS